MKQLIIIGAGGFGKEVLSWASQSFDFGKKWVIKGFLDDFADPLDKSRTAKPILGTIAGYEPKSEDVFICAIGQPKARRSIQLLISSHGGMFVNVIHRTVVMGENISMGSGVLICPYAVISTDISLGDGVAINLHSSINHDSKIGSWSQINCHCDITGGVILEDEVFLGSHASILPRVRVGRNAVIGAGAVVVKDVPAGITVVGVPARPLH